MAKRSKLGKGVFRAINRDCPNRRAQPLRRGGASWHGVAIAEPLVQVAVAASPSAERVIFGIARFAAHRTFADGGRALPDWSGEAFIVVQIARTRHRSQGYRRLRSEYPGRSGQPIRAIQSSVMPARTVGCAVSSSAPGCGTASARRSNMRAHTAPARSPMIRCSSGHTFQPRDDTARNRIRSWPCVHAANDRVHPPAPYRSPCAAPCLAKSGNRCRSSRRDRSEREHRLSAGSRRLPPVPGLPPSISITVIAGVTANSERTVGVIDGAGPALCEQLVPVSF